MTTIRIGNKYSARPGYHETGTPKRSFHNDQLIGYIQPWRDGPKAKWQYAAIDPDGNVIDRYHPSEADARVVLVAAHHPDPEPEPIKRTISYGSTVVSRVEYPAVVVTPSGLQTLIPGCEPAPEVKGDAAQQRMF
jgi:hypothetical protein